ncbi:DUF3108 domain-containing protein [Undibacter mobilis]|uniref:DUF3108 domain-containing protein n=1 Tax=Undibacter mobilis TaxID=2292256 RepID=A0A371B8I0_9BRAD|nr:DUF3108 domain-containing protein [Undibacter mobilis]RDV03888.1 DUF3108 domain-containing protein [Undibacter mobilis]
MLRRPAICTAGLTIAALLAALPGVKAASPPPEVRVVIQYAISMIGVPVGRITWAIDLGANDYKTTASGKASRAVSILVNGEGRVAVQGVFEADRAAPSFFSSNVVDDGETTGLQMTFESGNVKALRIDDPPDNAIRIPVTDEHKRNVTDPLSAMLIPATAETPPLSPIQCNRNLSIFDGQRRYDLVLTYKRMDKLKLNRGYNGPALVCAVVLHPIAGYRPDSMLVKYVGGRPGLEIWFMPIEGTPVILPGLLKMPTGVGTLEIEGERLERTAVKPAAPAAAAPGK